MLYFHTYGPEPYGAAWGFETGMISKSLAEGHGFSSPFGGDTGPTAWFPPLHPALQALVFKSFGIQSTASAVVMRLFNIACSLGALVFIFRICRRLWGERFGFAAAWIWALYPCAIWFDVTLISYGVLSVLLLLAAIDLALAFDIARRRDWVRQGLLWGVIALANPSLLSLLPICWLVVALRCREWKPALRGFAISSALAFALVAPWTLRNYFAFRAWLTGFRAFRTPEPADSPAQVMRAV
jgi:4-amino-4-deoxy-L-arabinose transferase-like glycosyltransferase